MRIPFRTLVCTLTAFAVGQMAGAQGGRVSAIVQLQRDAVGANLVRVSVLDPNYPVDVLKAQIAQIGTYTGGGARGVQITDDAIDPKKPNESKLLRATFAVDGLIDRKGAWLKIAPIVKALAGAPAPHELENVNIDFDYEAPSGQDLGAFSSPAVDIDRRIVDRSLEYSVHYKTQDPAKIDVPDFAPDPSTKSTAPSSVSFSPDLLVVVTIGVAVIAVGALVYCLFLLNPFYRKKYRP